MAVPLRSKEKYIRKESKPKMTEPLKTNQSTYNRWFTPNLIIIQYFPAIYILCFLKLVFDGNFGAPAYGNGKVNHFLIKTNLPDQQVRHGLYFSLFNNCRDEIKMYLFSSSLMLMMIIADSY